MRVLLPLRKTPANNHDSSSSLSSNDNEEEYQRQDGEIAVVRRLTDDEVNPVGLVLESSLLYGEAEGEETNSIGEVDNNYVEFHQKLGPTSQKPNQTLSTGGQEEGKGKGRWNDEEAFLQNTKEESLKQIASSTTTSSHKRAAVIHHRKRKATGIESSSGGFLKTCNIKNKKRPAPLADRKPAARDLSKKMVGGSSNSRRRLYGNDTYVTNNNDTDESLLETTTTNVADLDDDPLENNPASAHGHPVIDGNENHDVEFALALKKRGLEIRLQDGDGNCLFRAVSLQVYGDPSMHDNVRQQCLDFMERDKEHFAQFVTGEPFDRYIRRKRQDGVHGNNPEIQAISELFNRPVEVYCPDNGAVPLNIFHAEYKTADAPIRLSYHDGNHYNAVVDPLVPTAGLGLGLPGLQPGLADKMQVARAVTESDAVADQMEFKKALKESEDDELQRAIKESKLSAEHMHSNEALALSDMDATYWELEQAALERSLQSYSSNEHGKKQKASSNTSRRRKHGRSSPDRSSPCGFTGQSSTNANTKPVASLPKTSSVAAEASIPPAAAAAAAGVASVPVAAAAAAKTDDSASAPPTGAVDEYPQTVQELVMNGFPLNKVVRAYEIIGEDFGALITFLMSNSS